MKILVCIKQVPGSNNVQVDPETGVLRRDGVAGKMNPYDLYGLELAVSLAERFGGEVETITMGPPQAKEVVIESVCMGAARGTVISDRKFAGADVLATAYTLSQGIKAAGEFDLIICGKQTTDGDTAQVGAETAEYLGLPNINNVRSVEDVRGGKIFLTTLLDDKIIKESVTLPCLICADGDINSPRLPSYRVKKSVSPDAVRFLSFTDMPDGDETHYGLSGSATQVEKIFPPEKNTDKRRISGTPNDQANGILEVLQNKKLL